MKKILSLVLALAMILSCVAALAESPDRNMTNEVSEPAVPFLGGTASSTGLSGYMDASQHTDVWLTVEASGQIDVTVPLVAIFRTNIDGGKDTISEKYVLTNYSSAAITVTKLEILDQFYNVQTNNSDSDKNMEMVAKSDLTGKYNKYALSVKPDDQYTYDMTSGSKTNNKRWSLAQDVASATSAQSAPLMTTNFVKNSHKYTLDSGAKAGDEKQGLWLIERNPNDGGTGKKSYMEMVLDTSKLTFVTSKKDNGVPGIEDGIKLFTVTYTVKIDDSAKVGEDIHGDTTGTVYNNGTKPATPAIHQYEYNGIVTIDKTN